MERDFWDILALVATISTGVIIALAASLAFVIQRARYFREVEPELNIENMHMSYERASSPQSIVLHASVRKGPSNHLQRLRLRPSTLSIFDPNKGTHVEHLGELYRGSLLPGQYGTLQRSVVPSDPGFELDSPGIKWDWQGTIIFSPRRDAALVLMNPWSLGLVSFTLSFHEVWEWYTPGSGSPERYVKGVFSRYNQG